MGRTADSVRPFPAAVLCGRPFSPPAHRKTDGSDKKAAFADIGQGPLTQKKRSAILYTCAVLRFPPSLKESDGQGRSPHPVDFAKGSALWRRSGPISPLRLRRGNLPLEKNAFPLCSPKAVEIHPNPFPSVPPPNHVDSHTALFPVARKGVLSRRRPIGCFKRPKGLCANGGSPFPAPVHTAFCGEDSALPRSTDPPFWEGRPLSSMSSSIFFNFLPIAPSFWQFVCSFSIKLL